MSYRSRRYPLIRDRSFSKPLTQKLEFNVGHPDQHRRPETTGAGNYRSDSRDLERALNHVFRVPLLSLCIMCTIIRLWAPCILLYAFVYRAPIPLYPASPITKSDDRVSAEILRAPPSQLAVTKPLGI